MISEVLVMTEETKDETKNGKVDPHNPSVDGVTAEGSRKTGKNWYSVYVQSGCELKALEALKHRINQSSFKDKFGEILLPKVSQGDNESRAKKLMPGYIFIEMEMTDDTWDLVRKTPKVLGFIGGFKNPPPIPENEIARIKEIIETKGEALKVKLEFSPGDIVVINDGPFKDFTGRVTDVDNDKSRLTVEISIFGRPTPVHVDFIQVNKK
ncbi:MAG: transcription termination/antitermination protein NusG [Deltaproteobacteria bacterium]|nr:transcription termination/antitermination protein NusG [Deltaproteobacteria bacterium]